MFDGPVEPLHPRRRWSAGSRAWLMPGPERSWIARTFAEGDPAGHASAMVGLWLAPDAAAALAVDGGAPAEALHLTLCVLERPAAELSDIQVARLLTVCDDLAAWTAPLAGDVAGLGRFYATEASDARDVVFALPSVPGLAELRARLCEQLGWQDGLAVRQAFGWIPHVTLAYVEPGAASPVDAVPTIPLRFDALTVALGDRRTAIPLRGVQDGPMPYADATVLSEGGRLFHEVRLTEAPAWLPLLPVPGEYLHPTWGTIALTPERIARLVASVNEGIYQASIPVDAEHELDVSGALGWFAEARINPDGSADVRVEWNDRGRELLAGDRFRYVSPTFWTVWTDPVSGAAHEDVVTGLALCTRPFFKSLSIDRALVASARGTAPSLSIVREAGEPVRFVAREAAPAAPKEPPMTTPIPTPSEKPEQPAGELAFADLQAKFAELQGTVTDLTGKLEAAEGRANRAEERLTAMERERQRKAFTDEVMGRSDANNIRWFGDVEQHVQILEALPEERRQAYIEQQRAQAKRLTEAIGEEAGSDARPEADGQDAWSQIQAKVRAFREADPMLSGEAAMRRVMTEHPELYRQYREEAGRP